MRERTCGSQGRRRPVMIRSFTGATYFLCKLGGRAGLIYIYIKLVTAPFSPRGRTYKRLLMMQASITAFMGSTLSRKSISRKLCLI